MTGRLVVLFTAVINLRSRNDLVNVVSRGSDFDEVVIAINADGGEMEAGFGLYDQLRDLPIDFTTHNIGSVKSAANLIFAAGKKRLCCPDATFMLHGTATIPPYGRLTARVLKGLLEDIEDFDQRMRSALVGDLGVSATTFEGSLRDDQTVPAHHTLDWGFATGIAPFTIGTEDDLVVI